MNLKQKVCAGPHFISFFEKWLRRQGLIIFKNMKSETFTGQIKSDGTKLICSSTIKYIANCLLCAVLCKIA